VIVGLIGMLLIVRPGTETFAWASLLVLGAALCYGGQQLATRHLSVADPPSTTLVYTSMVGGIAMSFAAPFVWQTPSWVDVGALVSLGLIATVGHFMLIKALTLAPASLLAPLDYTSLIWGSLLGVLVFNEVLDPLTLAGAGIIAAAGLFIYLRERQLAARIDPNAAVPPTVG
jgi:drug/metabolite transporter (DMT)-like permease